MSKKKSNWGKFALGAAVGGALGILFAPKKGSETRKEIKEKMMYLIEKVKELDSEELKNNILTKIDEIKQELKELDKEKIKKIASEKVEVIKKKCDELTKLVKDKTTPIVEKTAEEFRTKTLLATKEILKRLEEK